MANNIVKYSNEMNTIAFSDFSSREMNIFFSIIAKIKEKNTDTVHLTFDEVAELSNLGNKMGRHVDLFIETLESTYDKITDLKIKLNGDNELRILLLFDEFVIKKDEQYVEISVAPKAVPLLNNLSGSWTRFNLLQFSSLTSTYAKSMFRLVKQYRTTGYLKLDIEKLRYLLDVPTSYKTGDITRRVISPIKSELAPIFAHFTVKTHRKGKTIVGYQFSWKPEGPNQDDFDKAVWNKEKMISNVENNDTLTEKEKKKALKIVNKIDFDKYAARHISLADFTESSSSPEERKILKGNAVSESTKTEKKTKPHIPLYRWSDKPDTFSDY